MLKTEIIFYRNYSKINFRTQVTFEKLPGAKIEIATYTLYGKYLLNENRKGEILFNDLFSNNNIKLNQYWVYWINLVTRNKCYSFF